ncbi:MAG: transposase [Legionella sp.]|nr:transposase [Legionella sp.]
MRQVTKYAPAIKANVLSKALAPNASSVLELSKVFNIPPSTIHTWLSIMGKKENIKSTKMRRRPQDESVSCKFQAVIDTIGKTDEEQGSYCRTKGIHSNHLELWKQQMLEGLGNTSVKLTAQSTKANKAAHKQIEHENKQLKRELTRKEKALAEITALLVLKKKADLFWEESEDV